MEETEEGRKEDRAEEPERNPKVPVIEIESDGEKGSVEPEAAQCDKETAEIALHVEFLVKYWHTKVWKRNARDVLVRC